MIPAPLLPYADFLLGLTLFLSACASVRRQGVNMESHVNRWLMIDGRRVPFGE
jgi:hypothetical protein